MTFQRIDIFGIASFVGMANKSLYFGSLFRFLPISHKTGKPQHFVTGTEPTYRHEILLRIHNDCYLYKLVYFDLYRG